MKQQATIKTHRKDFTYSSFRLGENGLQPIGTPTRINWQECGRFLRLAAPSVHFWIGDWLTYGQAHFKNDYEEAMKLTGYSYHTLRKDKYVAERIPPERRRSNLDVALHQEVAPLPPVIQEKLLDKAENEQLSLQQLRMEKHRYLYEPARETSTATTNEGLFLGDSVSVLETLPDASVDCIVTDPPYGLSYQSDHRILKFDKLVNDGIDEAKAVLDRALAIAQKKLRLNSHVYVFSTWKTYPEMVAIVGKYFSIKNVLVWVKNNWTPGDLEGNYGHQYELIIFAHKGRRHLFGKREPNVLLFDRVGTTALQHPTEKPVKLLEYLIQKSTMTGETVLDMFMGSGSTCLAAKQTKRNYVGIEIDPKWYAVAQKRLA